MWISKLSIKSTNQWLHIFRSAELWENYQSVIGTREELIDALLEMSDSDEILAKLQEKKLEKKKEQYEKLQPVWFEYAPQSAIKKREELKNSDNVEKMKWLQNNVSYNADHTINIIFLKKTFCEDISWQNKSFNFAQAQELEKINAWWYSLMTDYNDCDTDDEKKNSDWYKVIHIFSNGNWDTIEGMKLFRDMTWCNNRYWTATEYKNDKWEKIKGVVRYRDLNKNYCNSYWYNTNYYNRVCGFKPAP